MTDQAIPRRPILRWFGGKWMQGDWIVRHFPQHRVYVESFGGAASVLIRKPLDTSVIEVLNDADLRLDALYRVLRSEALSAQLARALDLTPFSRTEFENAFRPPNPETFAGDDRLVEVARRLVVAGSMGYGTGSLSNRRVGFRSYTGLSRSAPVRDWVTMPDAVRPIHDRLRGVVVECDDAVAVIQRYDSVGTLHYVDPPYVRSTRSSAGDKGYAHEMDDDDHERLLETLLAAKGLVVLSGYRCALYDERLAGWHRVDKEFQATRGKRVESLWLSPRTDAARRNALPLFAA